MLLFPQMVTGLVEDVSAMNLWRVSKHVSRAIEASTYGSTSFVAAEVANLTHRDFQWIPMVFNFSSEHTRVWAEPGMVAGAMRHFAGRCVQRSYFILPDGDDGRIVRLSDFIVEAEERRKFWTQALTMSSRASWNKLRAHARVMWRRDKRRAERLAQLFREQQLYDMDFEWSQ